MTGPGDHMALHTLEDPHSVTWPEKAHRATDNRDVRLSLPRCWPLEAELQGVT